jgi:pimeloyl-ACP methyl ester carboxylesterase
VIRPYPALGWGLALALLVAACGGSTDSDEAATAVEPPEPTNASAEGDGDGVQVDTTVSEQSVRFLTDDGEELAGTLFGTGTEGIVLAHMRGRDETTWFDFARTASSEGYAVLTFSFRGYGDSTGDVDSNLDIDLMAAVEHLESTGVTDMVVMGASMGATATVNVASKLDLAGAVSLSAPPNFIGLDALDVATQVAEPLLLVVAQNDQPYADAAVAIAELAPVSQLRIFDGNAHGTNLFGDHDTELSALLLAFAGERLGQ